MIRRLGWALTLPLLTTTLPACSAGGVGAAVRPSDPNARGALGEGACRAASSGAQPLVVDLQPHERADFEEAMQSGVAVVAWDCRSLKLLRECRADGGYAFHSLSLQEFTVKLEDADEVRANLPTFGPKILTSFEAEMGRGATIDLAVSMVGKKRTTVSSLAQVDLHGGCGGATHYVRGVYLGAFAMTVGTRGQVKAAADIFGAELSAQSSSAKVAQNRDGDIAACRSAKSDAAAPPEGCRSLLRLELDPLDRARKTGDAKNAALASSNDACPDGMVLVGATGGTGGKCAIPGEAPFQCRTDKAMECSEQCGRGHGGSCATLGFLYATGQGVSKDPAQAASFLGKACDGGEPSACSNLGVMTERGEGASRDAIKAAGLYQKACDKGEATACFNLGLVHEFGRGGTPDPSRAADLYKRGCDGGEALACANLGVLTEAGPGHDVAMAGKLYEKACQGKAPVGCFDLGILIEGGKLGAPADPAKALALFTQACDLGFGDGCLNQGSYLEEGKSVPKDAAKALELYRRGCDLGSGGACLDLGVAYDEGQGVPADKVRAGMLFKKSCELGQLEGCVDYGLALESGKGVAKDIVKAAQLYDVACKGKLGLGCVNLGDLLASGRGVPRDDAGADKLFHQACDLGSPSGCGALGGFVETGKGGEKKDRTEAVRLYKLGCAGVDEPSCKALERLGVPRGL